jgi:protein SCO1/2
MKFLILPLFLFFAATSNAHEHHSAPPADAPSTDSIFNLDSQWTDQNGKAFSLRELSGSPSVISMAYTNCQSSCPLIVEAMRKIEAHVAKTAKKPVRFLLFSFDSKRDTPQQLKAFAEKRKLDLDHWTLLHGDPKAVRDLAAVLGIRYKKDAKGEFDHSNVITLLDSAGVVKTQIQGVGQSSAALEAELLKIQ